VISQVTIGNGRSAARPWTPAERFAPWLAGTGAVVLAVSIAFLLFVAAYPLGLVAAYPAPPRAAVDGPLGLRAPITDLDVLYRRDGEPMPAYLERLTDTVAGGMVHYWTAGEAWTAGDAAYTGIGILDNYLLWGLRQRPAYRANFENYEFLSPGRAIGRGYGFCSQVSKTVYAVLREQGIPARVLASDHHVVVEAGGSILDADYGVFIPHPMEWVRRHLDRIAVYYGEHPSSVAPLRDAYADPWRELGDDRAYDEVRAYEEKFERLKWLPPMMGISIGLALLGAGILFRRYAAGGPRHG
jgi:hypothetical protein